MENFRNTVSFWNSKGFTIENGWVRIMVFTQCDLDVIDTMSRKFRFLPFIMTSNGDILEPIKDTEAEVYVNYLSKKQYAKSIGDLVAKTILLEDSDLLRDLLRAIKLLLQTINKQYYEDLQRLLMEKFFTQPTTTKKRPLECGSVAVGKKQRIDEEEPKRTNTCGNCNETGHTRPTCRNKCKCSLEVSHEGQNCPSLKKNQVSSSEAVI